MSRRERLIVAAVLFAVCIGLAIGLVALEAKNPQRLTELTTVVGFVISTVFGAMSILLAWFTVRRSAPPAPQPTGTGRIVQEGGSRNVASTGTIGIPAQPVTSTGAIEQRNTSDSFANTGQMDRPADSH